MSKPLVWLDLCSGLGGASQPALDRGWTVWRVDIDANFKPDIVADLLNPVHRLRIYSYVPRPVNVVWASPVCTEFTKAGLPKSWAANRKNPPKPDTHLTEACRKLIENYKPLDAWIIENVLASRRYLNPILGAPFTTVDGHVLWGIVPCLIPQTKGHKWRLPPSPDRAAKRAMIPYEIGEAICRAVEARQ